VNGFNRTRESDRQISPGGKGDFCVLPRRRQNDPSREQLVAAEFAALRGEALALVGPAWAHALPRRMWGSSQEIGPSVGVLGPRGGDRYTRAPESRYLPGAGATFMNRATNARTASGRSCNRG
jgi:hypothetical protein